jgi:Glycosyltransferase 61
VLKPAGFRPHDILASERWTGLIRKGWRKLYRFARGFRSGEWVRPLRDRSMIARHPVCESILQWALATPGARVERIRPSLTIERVQPQTIGGNVHPYLGFPPAYVVPEKYLACVPGGRLVGKQGLVVLPDGSFSAESIYDLSQLGIAPDFRAPLPHDERYQPGNYYSLIVMGSEVGGHVYYYHWLHDVVLRLHEIADRVPPDTFFIVPGNRFPFQDELLFLAGIDRERLWEWDGTSVLRLENLYFSPPTPLTGTDSPETDLWFRNRAMAAYGVHLGPASRRIFISRKHMPYHHIVNEPEVEAVLSDFGFEVHCPEQYSLGEQVELFAHAEVVIGGHGSGMTNILFSPPGLTLIDVFTDKFTQGTARWWTKAFWSQCIALGHHYWYLTGDAVPSRSGSRKPDIYVPPGRLREAVEAAVYSVSP